MIIMVALVVFLILYYKNADKKLQNYTPVTAYVTSSEYDWARRKNIGGSYKTTVQYSYNGISYTQKLRYNTKKMCDNEALDCLINPQKPQEIYPASAHTTNKRIIMLGWIIIAFFTIYPLSRAFFLLYMS